MKLPLKTFALTAAGAGLGFAYYYFIGCNSGTCPLVSTWYITTGYGAAMGLILGFPVKKKPKKEAPQEEQEIE